MSDKPKVIIATMAWENCPAPFLLEWTRLIMQMVEDPELPLFDMYIGFGCLLPHARNHAVASIYKNHGTDWTHLMFIDSDMAGLDASHIRRMLAHDVPIVGALATRQSEPFSFCCEAEDQHRAIYDELEKEEPGLVPRRWVGTAYTLIRREVFDAVQTNCAITGGGTAPLWFRVGRIPRPDFMLEVTRRTTDLTERLIDLLGADSPVPHDQKVGEIARMFQEAMDIGLHLRDGGGIMGEDMYFGVAAEERGFPSYVDCGIQIGHFALHPVGVAAHMHVRGEKERQEEKDKES